MTTRVVNLNEVAEQLGVSKRTLRRQWQAGEFPEPIRVSPRKLVWPREIIDAFLHGDNPQGVKEIQL